MSIIELALIAVGLSMDAFAIAVCIGLSQDRFRGADALKTGAWFGVFQAAMPLAGYFIGGAFADKIERYDHWVAFALLAFIGGKMAVEGLSKSAKNDGDYADALRFSKMLPLALATSIDALAIGVSFAFLDVNIVPAVCFIGAVTLILSAVGVRIGVLVGARFRKWAAFTGGVILIAIGVKTLLEHTGVLG